jgi:hypothetical protein
VGSGDGGKRWLYAGFLNEPDDGSLPHWSKSLRKLASLFSVSHRYVITRLQEQQQPDLHQHCAPECRDNEAVCYDSARGSVDVFIKRLPGYEAATQAAG